MKKIYPNNFENGEFDKEAPQSFDLERVTIAREQGASEDQNFEVKPTSSKTNFRSCLGIYPIFFFMIFFLHPIFSTPYSIVFIHIGKELPSYLETAINQARLFNPNAEICLIANESALTDFPRKTIHGPLTQITCESIKKSSAHLSFLKSSKIDRRYREGFWSFAVERFFYLDDFMSQYRMEHVFHLENDNMLYVNLEELLPIFQEFYKGIGATFHNDQLCIPGFMYIAHASIMHKLSTFIVQCAQRGCSDMESIALFKNALGKDSIDYLPIVPDRYVEIGPMNSLDGEHNTSEPHRFQNHFNRFLSIFDGATLGQYLGGIDPFHQNFMKSYINPSSIFNPNLFTFEWETDQQGRKVPYAAFRGRKCRINSLHIHCKRLDDFYSK